MWLSLWYIRGDRGDRNAENEGHRIPGRPGCGRHGLYCLEGMRGNARSEVKHHLLGPRLGRRVGNDAARRYTAYVGLVSTRPQAASGCGKRSRHTLFTFGEVRQEGNCQEGVVFPTEGRRAAVRLCIANVMEMILTRNPAGLFVSGPRSDSLLARAQGNKGTGRSSQRIAQRRQQRHSQYP